MEKSLKSTKSERAWILYDWANSVYATIIMVAIFPIYFASIAPEADMWWGYATSASTFVVAVLAPVLGAVADYRGMKKKLFLFFLILGVAVTFLMAFLDNWVLLLLGYVFSYIGFAGSCLFYDGFLTDVTIPERMDSVSAKGYAMGYIGGSTIPFVAAIALTMLMNDSALAVKISVVLTSVWWLVFSIPFLKNVRQIHSLGEAPKNIAASALKNIAATFRDMSKNKSLFLFVLAYFFYIDGVNTVIHMSTAYGTTLGLGTTGMVAALLATQLIAAPCSVIFGRFSKKIGSIKMISFAVAVYFAVCAVGFYMGFSLEPSQFDAESRYFTAFDSAAGTSDSFSVLKPLYDEGLSLINSNERASNFSAAADELYSSGALPVPESTLTSVKDAVTAELEAITADGEYDRALGRSNVLFWLMAALVGTCQGGIQALSRSYFGKLVPPEKSNEYFGFFDIFGKFAAVIGPALYAVIKDATGRSSYGIVSLMLLFAAGGALLMLRSRYLKKHGMASD